MGGKLLYCKTATFKELYLLHKKGQSKDDKFNEGEIAFVSAGRTRMIDIWWNGFGTINSGEQRFHPTQKPVKLYKWLLDKYAKEGDKILDTHLGSMSIAIACHDYGFELTGCELDEDYYKKGIERIKNHTAQQKLF